MAYDRTIPVADDPVRAERLSAWARRKPRVAVMGEFSAGKSTLLNFLIEEDLIPTRATATEVPPVWFSHGDTPSYWVDEHGDRHPVVAADLATVPMSARYVRIFSKAEILEHCDIVDTPGISDPNLAADSWRFAAGIANMVLWCSSATQAWRETERSTWLSLPERLRRHSLIVVTRADKLLTQTDRDKVQRRLARETTGLFRDMVFMATPDAVRAKAELARGEETPLWETSGAAALLDRLVEQFEEIYEERGALLRRHLTGEDEPVEVAAPEPVAEEAPAGPRPVRVQVGSPRRTERPRAEEAEAVLARLRDEAEVAEGPLVLEGALPVPEAGFGPGEDEDKETAVARDALGLDLPAEDEAAPSHQSRPGYAMWFGAREARAALAGEADAAPAPAEDETGMVAADAPASDGVAAEASAAEGFADEVTEAGIEEPAAGLATAADEADDALIAALFGPADAEEAGAPPDGAAAPETDADMLGAIAAAFGAPGDDALPPEFEDASPAELGLGAWADAVIAEAKEPEPPAVEAVGDEVADPEAAEPEAAEVEALATGTQPEEAADLVPLAAAPAEAPQDVAPVSTGERPFLLDAAHQVAAPAVALPAAVLAWRGIVARTELLPGNAQIAAMIEELLTELGTVPVSAAPEPAEESGAEEADAPAGDFAGWRRLA